MVYSAVSIPQIINEPIIKPGVTLNNEVSISIECLSVAAIGFKRLIIIITATVTKKVIDILSRNG